METQLLAGLIDVSIGVLGLATALIKSRRSRNGDGRLTEGRLAILAELRAMNGALGRIEVHQENFAQSQARTAEALAYWKGRIDAAPIPWPRFSHATTPSGLVSALTYRRLPTGTRVTGAF